MKKDFSTMSTNLDQSSAHKNVSDEAPNEPTDMGEGPVPYAGPELNDENAAELPQESPRLESHYESHSFETERSDSIGLVKDKTGLSSLAGRATGPRTPAGKKRTQHNSLKFGIFSKVALLKSEKRSELQSLLSGLRNDFRPEGMFEEILVDELATLYWRLRRLMIAEVAEIEKATSFLEWDERERHEEEALETSDHPVDLDAEDAGLICKIANPKLLQRCLDLLKELKEDVETRGFDSEIDLQILIKLYGRLEYLGETLFNSYRIWHYTAECSDEERAEKGYASVEQCKWNFLSKLEAEIRRLTQYKKARASIESERMKLECLRRGVLDGPDLDRLLQYATSLERAIDRILTRLERQQRMRLNQPVMPPIKVDVSS